MMQAIWKRRNSDEGGFTLVELLVVIAILGILAAVAVFAIGGTAKTSKGAACKTDVATVQTASDAYLREEQRVCPRASLRWCPRSCAQRRIPVAPRPTT